MTTIDNTKRRFAVAIFTTVGLKYEGTVSFTTSQIDKLRLDLKQKHPIELPVNPTQVVIVPHGIVASLVINEIVVDKLASEGKILTN